MHMHPDIEGELAIGPIDVALNEVLHRRCEGNVGLVGARVYMEGSGVLDHKSRYQKV